MAETTETITKEIHIDASPETVFGFFTEAEKLTRWFCSEATTDPRPGGINHQTHPGDDVDGLADPNGPYFMQGEFLELDPPHRVVFTWGYTNSSIGVEPGLTRVEVTFTEADGGTDLRLVHSRIPNDESGNSFDKGWDQMLGNLAGAF